MIMIRKNMYMSSTFTWIGGFSGLVMQPDCKYVYHIHKTDYTLPQGFHSYKTCSIQRSFYNYGNKQIIQTGGVI